MIKIFLLELLNISGSDPCICLVQTPCSSKTTVPEFYEYAKFETVIHLGCSGVLLLANTMFGSNSIADWQCFQTPHPQFTPIQSGNRTWTELCGTWTGRIPRCSPLWSRVPVGAPELQVMFCTFQILQSNTQRYTYKWININKTLTFTYSTYSNHQ